MKALDIQKQLNSLLSKAKTVSNVIKSHNLYQQMNELRIKEGLAFLKLEGVEKRFTSVSEREIYNYYAKN